MSKQADPASPPNAHCANCGAPLHGAYCARCGQRAYELRVTSGELAREYFGSIFSLDSRIARTLRTLFRKPGQLSKEVLSGRRARYSNPARLYIFASLFAFLVISIDTSPTVHPGDHSARVDFHIGGDTNQRATQEGRAKERAGDDSPDEQADEPAGIAGTLKQAGEKAARQPELIKARFERLLPYALFLTMPILALLLKLGYRRPVRLYIEHLVFVLHIQSFAFIVIFALGLLEIILRGVSSSWATAIMNPLDLIALGYMAVYVYLAMRRFYDQSRARTLLKYGIFGVSYVFLLTGGMLTVLLASTFIPE